VSSIEKQKDHNPIRVDIEKKQTSTIKEYICSFTVTFFDQGKGKEIHSSLRGG